MTRPPVDIGALADPTRAPKIKLGDRELSVRPLSGGSAHRLAVAQSSDNDAESLAALLHAANKAVPELTPEEVGELTIGQITAILRISRGQLEDVEAEIEARQAGN